MFTKLFVASGLSLDRLKALLEVGAAGSIVKAAGGDPVKQSQYSRQIKELEDFFQTQLVERQGKGIRLTHGGRELARISRFFMLGLSNFQRGCLTEEQTYRIGASATFIQRFLVPAVTAPATTQPRIRYALEVASDQEIERRLHDLTLVFGIVSREALSRPLQLKGLKTWRLQLWAPKALYRDERAAAKAFKHKQMPLVFSRAEIPEAGLAVLEGQEPQLACASFLEAKAALNSRNLAVLLPDFLGPEKEEQGFFQERIQALNACTFCFQLAWNPRLLRLNPHATRRRDALIQMLTGPAGRRT